MNQNEHTLYGLGAHGIRVYRIRSNENMIIILANGTKYTERVNEGLQGRSIAEQVTLRVNARVRVKLDSGFKRSREELGTFSTNQMGFASPMLAQPLKRTSAVPNGDWAVQPKFNGHRCLMNTETPYSRKGKPIPAIKEIIDAIDIPPGVTLDGELYHHGTHLQTIASWVKRRQENTKKVTYRIYDCILPNKAATFIERFKFLRSLDFDKRWIRHVRTDPLRRFGNVNEPLHAFRKLGYEGAILRNPNAPYECGVRSHGLIKVKLCEDAEFECVDIVSSVDGWGILVLVTEQGRTFKASAPGTHTQKRAALVDKEMYIGRMVTCEYAELTKDLIPFHCVATAWRVDI